MIPTMVVMLARTVAAGLSFWRYGDLRGPSCWLPKEVTALIFEQCQGDVQQVIYLLDEYNRRYRNRPNLYPIWIPGLERARFRIGTRQAFSWSAERWRRWQRFLDEYRSAGRGVAMPLDLQRLMPLY